MHFWVMGKQMPYEAVIGLEIHAELATRSKMFCACPVVDPQEAAPNTAVCPVCAGMPGTLPAVNAAAVEYGLRVALALGCEINLRSLFARKNYFYPDLPKGYQISQYEQPLARNGRLTIYPAQGEKTIRIRRVHLEEDTGKLTHLGERGSLVDLNRAGVPLLEIVTEPDFRTPEEVRLYAQALRAILRYLGVNSGDMQKGALRIEPNISLRPAGSEAYGTKVEVKNLNSFRALERAVAYEIERQTSRLEVGETVRQVTMGWDETRQVTVLQRVKEGEDDYRYFPEPDLPPLVLDPAWIERLRAGLPELPEQRARRFVGQYGLSEYTARLLVEEKTVADYFEEAARHLPPASTPDEAAASMRALANWLSGDLFGLMNQAGVSAERIPVPAAELAELVSLVEGGQINPASGRAALAEMFASGGRAAEIVSRRGLQQVSDADLIARLVAETLAEHPAEVASFRAGKITVLNWLFGQVMRKSQGRADPRIVRQELEKQLGGE
ncbi:MAG: Asp-tRNA(Asn)/Glu-tRNA(Gln) amidotransferase subunit GatB [Anaerolineales bacterium]